MTTQNSNSNVTTISNTDLTTAALVTLRAARDAGQLGKNPAKFLTALLGVRNRSGNTTRGANRRGGRQRKVVEATIVNNTAPVVLEEAAPASPSVSAAMSGVVTEPRRRPYTHRAPTSLPMEGRDATADNMTLSMVNLGNVSPTVLTLAPGAARLKFFGAMVTGAVSEKVVKDVSPKDGIFALWAMRTLYECQTSSEKMNGATMAANGYGFSKRHETKGSTIAKKALALAYSNGSAPTLTMAELHDAMFLAGCYAGQLAKLLNGEAHLPSVAA